MITCIVLIIVILLLIRFFYIYYRPEIELITSIDNYRIYLWYNSYDNSVYKGRVYKCLIRIKKHKK